MPVGLATMLLGMRRLRESRAAETAPPDLPGAVLLVARTRRIAAPVLEPALLRTRWVRAANAGTMAFGAALFAANLCAVLFATSVWGWTPLETGIAAIPGALASAVAAPLGGRWATRSGPRPVAVAGAGLFAAALAWVVVAAGEQPDFLGVWLPYGVIGSVGIGLGLPTLIGATASGLPARVSRGVRTASSSA